MHGHFQKRGSEGRTARTMKSLDSRRKSLRFISTVYGFMETAADQARNQDGP